MSTIAAIGIIGAAILAGYLIGWGSGWRLGYQASVADVIEMLGSEGEGDVENH